METRTGTPIVVGEYYVVRQISSAQRPTVVEIVSVVSRAWAVGRVIASPDYPLNTKLNLGLGDVLNCAVDGGLNWYAVVPGRLADKPLLCVLAKHGDGKVTVTKGGYDLVDCTHDSLGLPPEETVAQCRLCGALLELEAIKV